MRIHIGNISSSLAENADDLKKRLEKFAPIEGSFELRRKPHGDYYYSFVDMPDLDAKSYNAMRTALNGLLFRQSKLSVAVASKPDYTTVWEQRQAKPDPGLNPDQLKRRNSCLAHTNGRMRETKRDEKALKDATFRVLLDGRIRKPRMHKNKLWGVEKKPIDKLVAVFDDEKREWRDNNGTPIDFVGVDEHERNLRLLDTVNSAYLSDSDFDEYKKTRVALPEQELSDDELEIVPKESAKQSYPLGDSDSESDYGDMMNTSKIDTVQTEAVVEPEVKETQTDVLRSAFAVDAPFTLFGAPEPSVIESIQAPTPSVQAPAPTEKRSKLGLFFAHFESPFLRSQSQAARITGGSFAVKEWETEFWASRGEWNRTMRRRRREVAKKQRKQRQS